jgi:hypothetical protein
MESMAQFKLCVNFLDVTAVKRVALVAYYQHQPRSDVDNVIREEVLLLLDEKEIVRALSVDPNPREAGVLSIEPSSVEFYVTFRGTLDLLVVCGGAFMWEELNNKEDLKSFVAIANRYKDALKPGGVLVILKLESQKYLDALVAEGFEPYAMRSAIQFLSVIFRAPL